MNPIGLDRENVKEVREEEELRRLLSLGKL